ncbi:Autolysin [Slackia heliotrinireducens]|uniref:leucine-rich repeat protein n=1 Tax=Slackia heliotrinireducens TaxID=84110 RepID=UPI000F6EFF8F|nr:leucine-rich repeat protein [Slackia heliotrinireducens]VEH03836.1 Autolysin [Slackia heliotrinireducens]
MIGKKFLALLLSLTLAFCSVPAYAIEAAVSDDASAAVEVQDSEASVAEETSSAEGDVAEPTDEAANQDEQTSAEEEYEEAVPAEDVAVAEGEEPSAAEPEAAAEADEEVVETQAEGDEAIDATTWDAADFTYGTYSQLFYGCDYTRQLTVEGVIITGFSERGTQKLAQNTDLVIPAADESGNPIVGVGNSAFKGMGLTSVTFPADRMVNYNDDVTYRVTQRGDFVICENAFANNNLTSVDLPNGVLAVMSYAFNGNQLTTVTLPQTIWWIETMSFANNQITQVNFPSTCYFMLEMHGMAFGNNQITSVRLPDYTEVVNKDTFAFNPGAEPMPEDAPEKFKTYQGKTVGVVHMYAVAGLAEKDRIHHIDQPTASTKSYFQKLITDGQEQGDTSNEWVAADFTFDGQTITGLSESGIAKRATLKNLVLPDRTRSNLPVKKIAASDNFDGGLFATADEQFESVTLPTQLVEVGDRAFCGSGITKIVFSQKLTTIGMQAFANNNLVSVSLPNTVTTLGQGAFATNPTLSSVKLSTALTEIPGGAFGCSAKDTWMPNLTSIELHEGIVTIGDNAFAGNNFKEITLPSTVKTVGRFAFSSKNYLMEEGGEPNYCSLTLNEGLESIGSRAFRNKAIAEVTLPTTLTSLPGESNDPFTKEFSGGAETVLTKVYVTAKAQYDDKTNFANTKYRHVYYLGDEWTAEDFTYGDLDLDVEGIQTIGGAKLIGTVHAITGLSEVGLKKVETNKDLVLPSVDADGVKIQGIGKYAFKGQGIESIEWPTITVNDESGTWDADMADRGYFFIGYGAFDNNKLTTIEIPEGTLSIGTYAFRGNVATKVALPESIQTIATGAFAKNNIVLVEFPSETTYPTTIGMQSFLGNQIQSLRIPNNAETVNKFAFMQNTGMEPITWGNVNENKGGLVHMYVDSPDNLGGNVSYRSAGTSNVQELVVGDMPSQFGPWCADDFTFDGATVTGLSEQGKLKVKLNPAMVIPDTTADGTPVTAIGPGQMGKGTFYCDETVAAEDGTETTTTYVPTSVVFPSTLTTIGDRAFSAAERDLSKGEYAGLTSVNLPESVTSIGMMAFQNAPISGALKLPAGLTTLGAGAFVTNDKTTAKITSVNIPEGLTTIPANAFNCQAIDEIVIPEGVTKIDQRAFAGNFSTKLSLPSTLTSIGNYAFMNHQFETIELPESVTSVGNYAFQISNENLQPMPTKLVFNNGLTSVGNKSFAGSGVASATLPGTVTTLHKDAFAGSAQTVTLYTATPLDELAASSPKVVQQGTSHQVVYSSIADSPWSADDFTYSEDNATITGLTDSGKAKRLQNHELILPETGPDGTTPITGIADAAFAIVLEGDSAVDLSGADDPVAELSKFGSISKNGFTSVQLPSGLVSIGDRAFEYNALKSVDLAAAPGLTTIGNMAFHGNQLQSLVIPDSVTDLGTGAFAMNALLSLTLSKNVTVIPAGAFSMNIWLSSVTIPDTVTEIGQTAFAGARLTSLEIPASVTKIGRKAFHLHRITSLTIPGTVKELGESAFEGTYKGLALKSLTLEEGIESIGDRAFKEGLLETVALPSSLKTLEGEPFENNKGENGSHVVLLTSENPDHAAFNGANFHKVAIDISAAEVTVEGTVVYTGKAQEPALKVTLDGVEIPAEGYTVEYADNVEPGTATVTVTGKDAFTGTATGTFEIQDVWTLEDFTIDGTVITGLTDSGKAKLKTTTTMVMPSKNADGQDITEIGAGSFNNHLFAYEEDGAQYYPTSVTLPANLQKIGGYAFQGILVDSTAAPKVYGGVTQIEFPETLVEIGSNAFQNAPISGNVVIPENVTTIGNAAFMTQGAPLITGITLPTGLTAIPASLAGGQAISEVGIPDKVETIGASAFAGCPIVSVDIPASVTSIGRSAFAGVSSNPTLESITLHEGLQTIDRQAFAYSKVASAQLPASVATLHKDAFKNSEQPVLLYTDLPYSELASGVVKVGSGHEVVSIADWEAADFTSSEDGTTVTGLTERGMAKLEKNPNLVIPEQLVDGVNVTAIGDMAFRANALLESVSMPDTITTMGNAAFNSCPKLTSVKLSAGLTAIPDAAFLQNDANAQGIDELVIPEGVTSIGRNAFAGTKVTKLTLPSTLETIGDSAFLNNQIAELEIPASVKTIGKSAFSVARAEKGSLPRTLEKLTLNEGLETIEANAFRCSKLDAVAIPATLTTLHKDAFKSGDTEVGAGAGGKVLLTSGVMDQVTATGDYTGIVADGTCHVVAFDLEEAQDEVTIAIDPETAPYTSAAIEPAVTVKLGDTELTAGTDYELTFADNVEPGTATATVTGKGTFTGSVSGTFAIQAKAGWFKTPDAQWYYFKDADGTKASGWLEVKDKWYYFDPATKLMLTGWQKIKDKWYYLGTNGAMVTGWNKIGTSWYWFKSGGQMVTGWNKIGSSWYWFKPGGQMVTGWKEINGKWYWFKDGGQMVTGWQKISNKWYYFESSGAMKTGWLKLDNKWYYMNTSGAMVTGTQTIDGKTYRFNSSGVWVS